jgi:small subunit ribosomal protein S8
MTDPIADMLTRIRNAQMVKKSEVVLPYSNLKFNILKLLEQEGWVGQVEKIEPLAIKAKKGLAKDNLSKFASLKVVLKYEGKRPKISSLERISKPGRRVYISKDKITPVLNGLGLSIISTSHGLLTNKQARQQKLGGEIICAIY